MSVDFTYAPGPTARSIQFTDTSTPTPTFWAWDFGDGNTSNDQNPLHTYAGSGTETFNVTLETDPFADLIVSELPFEEFAQTNAALNADSQALDHDDLRGVDWTLQSFNKVGGLVGSGQMVLPAWGVSQSPISRAVLHSDVTPSFAAAGDFTMEFTVAPDNARGNWGGSSQIMTICGLSSTHGIGPVTPGEWMLTHSGGGGSLGFSVKPAAGSLVTALVAPSPINISGANVLAVQRISGVLSVLLAGATVALQDTAHVPPDSTTLFDQVTFGGNGDGSQIAANNVGSGTYSKWRYTVGAGRYPLGFYDPTISFDTSITEPVTVFGAPGIGPGAQRPVDSFGAVHVRLIDDVALIIRGASWSGWMDVRITRGIERLPSDFEVRLTERFPGEASALVMNPGDPCVLKIGPDVVLTGYVDRALMAIDAHQHTVTISGRSKCEDLVDCSAEWPGGEISGSSVLEVAQFLAKPHGISVDCIGDAGPPIPKFNLMLGETCFEIIERLCRFRQLLAYDMPDGNLRLARTGKDRTASGFQEGVNVLRADAMRAVDQQFAKYRVVLQAVARVDDLGGGLNLIGEFANTGIRSNRLRIIVAETGAIGQEVAADRGAWEAQRRWARSASVRITTDSWRDSAGVLYAPNSLAYIQLPTLHVKGVNRVKGVSWTISEVTYRRGDSGTTCDLVLMTPEAFSPMPTIISTIPLEIAQLPTNLAKQP